MYICMFHRIELKRMMNVVLGLRTWKMLIFDEIVLLMMLYELFLMIVLNDDPINIILNQFGWLGDQSWDFWVEPCWNRTFLWSWVQTWYCPTVPRFLQPCRDFESRMLIDSGRKNAPRFLKSWHDFCEPDPSYFTIFHPFPFWISLWRKHESCRQLS